MLPSAHRVVALTQVANPFSQPFLEQIEAGGSATGIVIDNKTLGSLEELEAAFAAMEKERPDAVIVQSSLWRWRTEYRPFRRFSLLLGRAD